MGKSIRSKRMKALRTLKRGKLEPVESVKITVRANKLHKVITNQVPAAADVEDISEVTNPSKSRPYKFNFLAAKLHREKLIKNGIINENEEKNVKKEDDEEEDEDEDAMSDDEPVAVVSPAGRRGRDRTVKPANAAAVLKNLQSQREAAGKLLPNEHEKKFHQNLSKSTAVGTTTNAPTAVKKSRSGNPHHQPGKGAIKVENSDDDDMGDNATVSYVAMGTPARIRRGKSAQNLRARSKSRGKAGITAQWHKLS